MDLIKQQIKQGVIRSEDLSRILETYENNVEIFKQIYPLIEDDLNNLAIFALILYKSCKSTNLFENFTLLYNKFTRVLSQKSLTDIGNNEYIKILLTLIHLYRENPLQEDYQKVHLNFKTGDALTLYLSEASKEEILKRKYLKVPPKYWKLGTLYALYLVSNKDSSLYNRNELNIFQTDFFTILTEYRKYFLLDDITNKKLFEIIKSNGDKIFLESIGYYEFLTTLPDKFKLIGPVSLSKHVSRAYNKIIYVFGDMHILNPECNNTPVGTESEIPKIDIMNFLSVTINSNINKKLDIFIESEIPTKGSKVSIVKDNYLMLIGDKFKTCFEKKKCEYPNAKFHYADPRRSLELSKITDTIRIFIRDKSKLDLFTSISLLHEIDIWIKKCINIGIEKLFPKHFKTIKQLNNINHPFILDILSKYENTSRNNNIEYLSKYYLSSTELALNEVFSYYRENNSLGVLVQDKSKLIKKLTNISNNLIHINAIEMDMYLMGRVFRKFGNEPESSNIIIYVGDAHAEFYRDLLLRMTFQENGYIPTKKEGEVGFQCLDISQFKLPFFS